MSVSTDLPRSIPPAAGEVSSRTRTALFRRRSPRHGSPPPHSRRRAGDLAALIAGLGAGAVVGSAWILTSAGLDVAGGPATMAGTLTAMLGTYLSLVLIFVVARIPWLEREIGQDRLIAFHRRLAPFVVVLITGHVFFTTLGYAQSMSTGWWPQFTSLVFDYPWMVPATVAFALMVVLSVASIRRARSKVRYETWWVGHLYLYLAVALGFGHQLALGSLFADAPWLRLSWIALYLALAVTVVLNRVLLPLLRHRRYRLRVAAVVPDSDGVVNVYFTGNGIERIPVVGGQFFEWRFGTRHWWWQAHPYSLSAAPDGRSLRITVKNLGDQSGDLATELKVGTPVLAEGPYGAFTADRVRPGAPVVALAAGVGVAPVLALLQSLPSGHEVTLIYRVVDFTEGSIPLRAEVETEAARCGWTLHYLTGEISTCRIDDRALLAMAPQLAEAEIFACGPAGFLDRIEAAALQAGAAKERFHHELFVF
ncbi:MAG: ferric reductase-like transmembrane domain-containing protein [Actinobacteria bacterium]|nr:ferric reductase-like transmembrane domain-containing protein [Actinomycetota bacterium]